MIWLPNLPQEMPGGSPFRRHEPLRVLAIRKSEVQILPTKTRIEAPEREGEAVRGWVVDGFERVEADHYRAVVVPDDEFVAS